MLLSDYRSQLESRVRVKLLSITTQTHVYFSFCNTGSNDKITQCVHVRVDVVSGHFTDFIREVLKLTCPEEPVGTVV